MKNKNYRLQFISHYNEHCSYVDSVRIALEGGCRWIQLRMKDTDEVTMEKTALIVQEMCKDYGATFIIDDNVSLVKKIKADGVHLGKKDMSIAEARSILGEQYIIGGTVNCFADILHCLEESPPDYFGCGPYRFTSTKKNLAPILGVGGYEEIVQKMRSHDVQIPIVAIGGIERSDIYSLLRVGVDGIALSGSVIRAEDPVQEMQKIVDVLKE